MVQCDVNDEEIKSLEICWRCSLKHEEGLEEKKQVHNRLISKNKDKHDNGEQWKHI